MNIPKPGRPGEYNPLDLYDLSVDVLERVVLAAKLQGSRVTPAPAPVGGAARHVGTFEGRDITVYPDGNSNFALAFTVAHLYGHQCQLTAPTPTMHRMLGLVTRPPGPLTLEEVALARAYEYEAAEIGLRLIHEKVREIRFTRPDFQRAYSRYFEADYRYLLGVLEEGDAGEAAFARCLRREPLPSLEASIQPAPIGPGPRLIDLRTTPPQEIRVVVV